MIVGLNHANISTAKLEETIVFFVEVLGFRVGPRPGFDFAGAWLYANGQPMIHLVERPAPREAMGAIDHISFTVDDFDAALSRLDRLGIAYRWSPIPNGFGRQAFVKDPNDVTIELTEPGGLDSTR
jgi:catechol 2,3-dioxygenase-like lactoylglutathione lyase family enzyme